MLTSIPFKRHEADAKCEELENLTLDLETRLENQATERMNLEKSFAEERRKLKQKLAAAESQTTELRELCNREKKMKQNVDDRLRRAEMELYHVLQRKYDIAKDVKAALKKEMVDNVKIKKDLTIREHLLSQKHQATLGPSKGRHISTPKHGHSQVCVYLQDTTWFPLCTHHCNLKLDFMKLIRLCIYMYVYYRQRRRGLHKLSVYWQTSFPSPPDMLPCEVAVSSWLDRLRSQ